ncbi:MAG: calcium-binding protein [Aquabacterium sp.]
MPLNSLLVQLRGSNDGLIVPGQFDKWGTLYGIEALRFADGTTWDRDELATHVVDITARPGGYKEGESANDTLVADGPDQTLVGSFIPGTDVFIVDDNPYNVAAIQRCVACRHHK